MLDELPNGGNPRFETELDGLGLVNNPGTFFVAPAFKPIRALQRGTSSLILISAPAAVGKTTVARQLSAAKDAPLWDLSKFLVGANSFQGTLLTSFGFEAGAAYLEKLSVGEALFVLDALDEGQLRAGGENFEAFLSDLARLYQQTGTHPSLVAFARADTAELTAIALEIEGVNFAHYEIDLFDEPKSFEFIDLRLDALHQGSGPHRTHRRPFEEARTALVSIVAELLGRSGSDVWESEDARGFLGYAPVLEALSEYLDVSNYQDLINELTRVRAAAAQGPSEVWSFFFELIREIQRREQSKVQEAVRPQLEEAASRAGWSDCSSLYGLYEQSDRLAARLLGLSAQPTAGTLSPELEPHYAHALEPFLAQHPFVGDRSDGFANVVFRDFLYAWILSIGSDGARQALRARLTQSYLAGPLLGRFLLNLSQPISDEQPIPCIDVADFPVLYESLRAQEREDQPLELVMLGIEEGFLGAAMRGGVAAPIDAVFGIRLSDSPVRFSRRISHASIAIEAEIELGRAADSFLIGPEVWLQCGRIRIESETLRVLTNDTDDLVILHASGYEGPQKGLQLTVYGDGGLAVSWPNVMYPWIEHRTEWPAPDEGRAELHEAARYLSRILMLFRSRGYGTLGRFSDTIKNVGAGRSELGTALLEYMISTGLIEAGRIYILNVDRMNGLGINWAEIRRREITPSIETYLREFLARRG